MICFAQDASTQFPLKSVEQNKINLSTTSYPIVLWEKTFGSEKEDCAYSIKQTKDGGYIIAGYTESKTAGWIIKTDSIGNKIWDRIFKGISGNTSIESIIETDEGGYIFAGYTGDKPLMDYGPYSLRKFWIVKLDSKGNITWEKMLYQSGSAAFIRQLRDGSYISVGLCPVIIVKLNNKGDLIWDKKFSEGEESGAHYVLQTKDGGYIILAYIQNRESSGWIIKIDFEGNIIAVGASNSSFPYYQGYILKVNSNGYHLWQVFIGGNGDDELAEIDIDSNNNIYVVGKITNESNGDEQVFIAKYDKDGNQI